MSSAMRWRITSEVVRVLEDHEGPAGYELNVSCPNTKHGGIFFSSDPVLLGEVVRTVRGVTKRPVIVKLSPNVARIAPLAQAAEEAGADAISLVNTFVSLAVDATDAAPAHRRRIRWTLRPGHQTHRAAYGVRSRSGGEDPRHRPRRDRHRRGCRRVPGRRSDGGGGRHGEFLGSRRDRPHRTGTRCVPAGGEDRDASPISPARYDSPDEANHLNRRGAESDRPLLTGRSVERTRVSERPDPARPSDWPDCGRRYRRADRRAFWRI